MTEEEKIIERQNQKLINNFNKSFGKTIQVHKMINENDKILVGLSGGKDSLVLLETLADRKRCMPFKFEIIAAHINVKEVSYAIDNSYLQGLCDDLDVPLYFKTIEVDINQSPKKNICFVCSWQRRKTLFNLTKKLNCNKLALGHHLDDANQTLLMNMVYHGSISSLPFKLKMFDGRLELIRPLLNSREYKIKEYAEIRKYPKEIKVCPFGDTTKRNEFKDFLNTIYNKNEKAAINIFRSPNKIFEEYLPKT